MIKRIIYSDNGVLTDISTKINSYHSGSHTFSYTTGEDYIYIGSLIPFNHFYLKLGATVNALASSIQIDYWDSKEFHPAIDIIDETITTTTLGQSGFITWSTDKDRSWIREDTNYGGNSVDGLTSLDIYDLYWIRLSFTNSLTANVILSWMGNKFADDNDLKDEHSDLVRTQFLTAYETGKTDWEAQHIRAAELLIEDMIALGIIRDRGQILKREELKSAAIKRVAQLIYSNMGKPYYDDRDKARDDYNERLNKLLPSIDYNYNGRFDANEYSQTGKLIR